MKRCPTCNRTFTDEWLAFCTEDGTTLVDSQAAPPANEPPPTVWIPPAADTNPATQKPFDLPGSYNPPKPAAPVWQPPPPPPMRAGTGQKQGLAIATLILGIFSITIGWCCSLGLLTAPVGIVLGIVSLVQIKNDPTQNDSKPLSLIGLILSSIYVVAWILIFILYGFAIFMGSLNH
jgi:Domain of unknown function (DUF4190)